MQYIPAALITIIVSFLLTIVLVAFFPDLGEFLVSLATFVNDRGLDLRGAFED